MDPREELEALRRLAELEQKAKGPTAADESLGSFVGRGVDKVVDLIKGLGSQAADLGRGALKAYGAASEGVKQVTPNNPLIQGLMNIGPLVSGTGNLALGESLLPTPQGDSFARQMERTALEGVGGVLALGPGYVRQAPKSAIASGAVGNVASDLSGRAVDGAVPDQAKAIVQALMGTLAGSGTAYLIGPRQSAADARLRTAMEGTSKEDWLRAWANMRLLGDTKTGTLAEAFPGNTAIRALAEETAASPGGAGVSQRIAGRNEELQSLGQQAAENLGRQISPAQVANALASSAQSAREQVNRTATEGLSNRLAGETIRPIHTAEIYRSLMRQADNTGRTELADAYREVAQQLLAQGGNRFLTDVQDLSFSLKSLKDRPIGEVASSGRKINAGDLNVALKEAEDMLAQRSPAFDEGMKDFRAFHQQVGEPMKEGIIGGVAFDPTVPKPAPKAVLNNFVNGQSAEDVAGAARTLQSPALTQGQPVDPVQIAQAIVRQKLEKGSTNPGQAVRGAPGSQADQNLRSLINAGGADADIALRPLAQADLMAGNFNRPPGQAGDLPIAKLSAVIRTRRFLDFLASKGDREHYYREISKIIAEPTQENMVLLREKAMFDPEIRRMLSITAAFNPILQGESK